MDRNWNQHCGNRSCRHPPTDHMATPELSSGGGRPVLWCRQCRRHEIARRRLVPWGWLKGPLPAGAG
ncbi:MAG: hypothetical protein WCB18_07290 [Thermoplasmata archaeon]